LPAVGQGALGIEALAGNDDMLRWLQPLNDATTAACVRAERAVARALGGSCETPLGAYAECDAAGRLDLRAFVGLTDGSRLVRAHRQGEAAEAEALGLAVADDLRAMGAEEILAALA